MRVPRPSLLMFSLYTSLEEFFLSPSSCPLSIICTVNPSFFFFAFSMFPSQPPSRGPSLDKLLQVLHRRHAQHEPSILVRHDRKLLRPLPTSSSAGTTIAAPEERLELLQRRLHRDDAVRAPPALEPRHGRRQGILGLHPPRVELRLQVRDGNVAEQRARLAVDNGQVRVVALKRGQQGEGDAVGRVEGQRGRGVEVFDGGLEEATHVSSGYGGAEPWGAVGGRAGKEMGGLEAVVWVKLFLLRASGLETYPAVTRRPLR